MYIRLCSAWNNGITWLCFDSGIIYQPPCSLSISISHWKTRIGRPQVIRDLMWCYTAGCPITGQVGNTQSYIKPTFRCVPVDERVHQWPAFAVVGGSQLQPISFQGADHLALPGHTHGERPLVVLTGQWVQRSAARSPGVEEDQQPQVWKKGRERMRRKTGTLHYLGLLLQHCLLIFGYVNSLVLEYSHLKMWKKGFNLRIENGVLLVKTWITLSG